MKKRIILFLFSLPLIASCGEQKIRPDIEEFVSSFSLENSFKEYRYAQYIDDKTSIISGIKKREIETFKFDSRDENNLDYCRTKETYIDDVLSSTTVEKCYKLNDKFVYELNEEKTDCDITKYESLVTKFFYKEIVQETYHARGMYYGDYVLDTMISAENFITIKDDLYVMSYSLKNEALEEEQNQTLKVNRLGMLESNSVYMRNGNNYISQNIVVTKLS